MMLFLILTAYFLTGSNSGPTLSSDRLAEVPILPEVGTYLIIKSPTVLLSKSLSHWPIATEVSQCTQSSCVQRPTHRDCNLLPISTASDID